MPWAIAPWRFGRPASRRSSDGASPLPLTQDTQAFCLRSTRREPKQTTKYLSRVLLKVEVVRKPFPKRKAEHFRLLLRAWLGASRRATRRDPKSPNHHLIHE